MNRVYPLVLMLGLLGAAPGPAALVVGTIRDQHGAPVEGAQVRLLAGARTVGEGTSRADGTFSIEGSGEHVKIECAYCRRLDVPISADGTVVAIVTRYDAIRFEVPTSGDLSHLPYARVESDVALTPFIVLDQSSTSAPGSTLNDRNAIPQAGLAVIDGVPDYDIVAAVTPFNTIPAFDSTSVSVTRSDQAWAYGDLANAGTFSVSTTGGASAAFAGSDAGIRANANDGAQDATLAWSDWNAGDRRARVDLTLPFASGTTQTSLNISSADGSNDAGTNAALDGSFSSARASIEKDGRIDEFATAIVDHATYEYQSPYAPTSAEWSDVDVTAGLRSNAVVAPFALVESRTSSGTYWSPSITYGSTAAVLQQTRGVAGVDIAQSAYDAEFTVGTDGVRYTGGLPGTATNDSAPSASGTLDVKLFPDWTLHLGTDRGYVLQTFLGLYQTEGYVPVDATSLSDAILSFDTESRLRASFTTQTSRDQQGDATSGTGASLGWQIAPALSLRAWFLRAQSTTQGPQTVGSAWLTYETSGLRIDAIWRRDLLDRLPDAHLDASIGGDLSRRMQWFVATERRQNIRTTDAGVRF